MSEQTKSQTPVCFHCGNTSENVALFQALIKNVEQWVCARCLPFLIHGPH